MATRKRRHNSQRNLSSPRPPSLRTNRCPRTLRPSRYRRRRPRFPQRSLWWGLACVCLLGTLSFTPAPADTEPVLRGAGFQVGVYAIRNARIVATPQQEIEQGTVVIRGGLIQAVGKEVFDYARERAGDDVIGEIAGAIPGLAQYI